MMSPGNRIYFVLGLQALRKQVKFINEIFTLKQKSTAPIYRRDAFFKSAISD